MVVCPCRNFTPTAENVNKLPTRLRKYIHDLETRCDPAGMVRDNTLAQDRIKELEAYLQTALQDDLK